MLQLVNGIFLRNKLFYFLRFFFLGEVLFSISQKRVPKKKKKKKKVGP